MLILKNIIKDYPTGDTKVRALKGININFRENEFVSILGPSGCGKTTMLNLIGGLDKYTEGDLVINGKSTKEFTDADWDTYRNHSIGFVFQSYNLIPHQTVLSNVELAQRYSTRIISCLDGQIIGDTNPFVPQKEDYKLEREKAAAEKAKGKKPSMNWRTAFSLSLKNLFTKKGERTPVLVSEKDDIFSGRKVTVCPNCKCEFDYSLYD